MPVRHSRMMHNSSVRTERREELLSTGESLPSGVRSYVLEMGRKIIEEDRELLDLLEAYDRREGVKPD